MLFVVAFRPSPIVLRPIQQMRSVSRHGTPNHQLCWADGDVGQDEEKHDSSGGGFASFMPGIREANDSGSTDLLVVANRSTS